MFDEPQTSPEKSGHGSLALTQDDAPATAAREPSFLNPPTTRLQVVQRSLSGGYLIQDAALLKANARSMFDEAGRHVLGGPPLT